MKWGLLLLTLSNFVWAADAQFSGKRDINVAAIVMFLLSLLQRLVTYWAARRCYVVKLNR